MDNQTRNILSNVSSEDLVLEILLRDREQCSKHKVYLYENTPEHPEEGDIYLNGAEILMFVDGLWKIPFLNWRIEVNSLEMKKAIRNANELIKNSIL